MQRNILVFDSGIGGLSILQELHKLMPNHNYSYLADNDALPYGEKSDSFLQQRSIPLFKQAINHCKADAVVIACNTASTLLLDLLRDNFDIPFIGVVPAIKPAAQITETGNIGLLATPATTKREYIDQLQLQFAQNCSLSRFASAQLVHLAEEKLLTGAINLNKLNEAIEPFIETSLQQNIDTIVLGCTHFPFLQPELQQQWPSITHWLDSGTAVARHCSSIINKLKQPTEKAKSALMFTNKNLLQQLPTALENFAFQNQQMIEI